MTAPTGCPVADGHASEPGDIRAEAEEFLRLFHGEHPKTGPVAPRLQQVLAEIDETGTYRHTEGELAFGARVAWRNNARCIGRLYWQSLRVRDMRKVRDAATVAAQCAEHLRSATNGGRIRPTVTVFAPDTPTQPAPRIWNEQLIRYAGYWDAETGAVIGDPRYLEFTEEVTRLGWQQPAQRTRFDVLPLVVETPEDGITLHELPRAAVHEVELSHPEHNWFAGLGLRWHSVPAISNMRLAIGGVSYPAAPFNGWYMGTEIGARNLADQDRYDLIGEVAERLGLDTSNDQTLWRDRALVELNRAVLHSFTRAEVTITDHHTESARFLTHLSKEEDAGRKCPADWSWIVPPMSGALTPVFHRYYDTEQLRPEYVLDEDARLRGTTAAPRAFPEPVAAVPPKLPRIRRLSWFTRRTPVPVP
ncbi:nitric oxide synthase oxygenase [Kutzneria sp. 744]|uniref:nitric oxide synthase oxygenase n=1 Tax=Kutzneria sp. (strain 744) TaxID=345341 RepID=UPI0003EEBC97|nr:nitric oxide synthase oxygenase [Kutzneria sp. 744]EWM16721.1 nitric oxide synthase [Kutzneria sp. 744]